MNRPVGTAAFDAALSARPGTPLVRPLVKVCGITRVEDAVRAADLGAAAIGFVFWRASPRAVTVDAARTVAGAVPRGVLRVGVFVNEFPHVVRRVVAEVPLDVVQLHGDEPVEWCGSFGRPVVKAIGLDDRHDERWLGVPVPEVTLLVDAGDRQRRGGTGRVADWDAAARLAAVRPIVLAGGLTPTNVAEAIRRVRPYAIDVASGVEQSPGVKDPLRLEAFFAAVREAWGGERTVTPRQTPARADTTAAGVPSQSPDGAPGTRRDE